MFIDDLKIKNFKNIEDIHLQFAKINCLSASNGEGKTSIIDALKLILVNELDDSLDEYIRWGEDQFRVECNLHHIKNKYNYSVSAGKGTQRLLKVNDTDIYKQSDATKYFAKIVDPTITLYSAISSQHQNAAILFEKPTPRLDKLKKIFKMGQVDSITEKIDLDRKSKDKQIDILKAEIESLEARQFTFQDEFTLPDISEIKKEHEFLLRQKDIHEALSQRYFQYLQAKKEYEAKLKQKDSIISSIEMKKALLIDLRLKRISEFNDEEYRTLFNRKLELSAILAEYRSKFEKQTEIITRLSSINKKILEKEKEYKSLEIEEPEKKSSKEDELTLGELISEKNQSIKNLNGRIILAESGQCPTCEQPTDFLDRNSLLKEKESEEIILTNSKNQRKIVQKNLQEYTQKYDIYKSSLIVKNRIEKEIAGLKDDLTAIEKPDSDDYRKKIAEIDTQFNEIITALNEFDIKKEKYSKSLKENEIIQNRKIQLESEIQLLEEQLTEYSEIETPEECVKPPEFDVKAIDNLYKQIVVYDQKEKELENIVEFNTSLKKERRRTLQEASKKQDEIDSLRFESKLLEDTKKFLAKEFSSHLIEEGTNFIQDHMNEFFQKSYGRYKLAVKRDKNSVEFLYSDKRDKWASVNVTGGHERSLLATSFRIALCKLQNLGIYIADEIDSDSSEEHSLRLYRNLLNENFQQIFVITHVEQTKDFLASFENSKVFEIKDGKLI